MKNQYFLVWIHDGQSRVNSENHFLVLGNGTLEEVSKSRMMSGDLVVDSSGHVAQNDSWLFPWERESENAYAKQMIQKNLKVW